MQEIIPNLRRPGWIEIVIGLLAHTCLVLAGASLINATVSSETVFYGLSLSALSALAGVGAFLAAYWLRIRNPISFGLTRVSACWLLKGLVFGFAVFVVSKVLVLLFIVLGGEIQNVQEPYNAAATSGMFSLLMQLLLIAVATPIGEELMFRGVVTNALLRYGPWVSILGSSVIFALIHGLNEILIVAFVTGLATSYLFYRTKSIWPGVIVHIVNNGLSTLLTALLALLV